VTSGGDGAVVRAEVRAAREQRAAHRRLTERIARGRTELAAAEDALRRAEAAWGREAADVARLESLSPTRIWATLRGSRDTDLDRERAEEQRAEYDLASARARRTRAREEIAQSERERQELGEVERRWLQALAALDAWAATVPGRADELREVTGRLAETAAVLQEVDEAERVGAEAAGLLTGAVELLRKAADWASLDLYGGGALTDLVKYDRLDRAHARLREAERALQRFSGELADVGWRGVDGVAPSDWVRVFDAWLDDPVSDWFVRRDIRDAVGRTEQVLAGVQQLRQRLLTRHAELASRLRVLTERQEALAIGPGEGGPPQSETAS
jgi:tetratricopeptide (TPR) repeat protein